MKSLVNVSHVDVSRNFSKNTRKLSLHPLLNIQLFPTHTKSELEVFSIASKLVKDVVKIWWWNFEKKSLPLTGCPNIKQPKFSSKEFGCIGFQNKKILHSKLLRDCSK